MRTTLLTITGMAFLMLSIAGCSAFVAGPGPVGYALYTDTKAPLMYSSYYGEGVKSYSKVGKASFTSILGLLCTGDASIEAAMKNGGITKIHHIDFEVKNILFLIATYSTVVYGE